VWVPVIGLIVIAGAVLVMHTRPIARQQAALRDATEALHANLLPRAIGKLDAAASIIPADDRTMQWRVRLRVEVAGGLAQAGRVDEARAMLDDVLNLIDRAERADPGRVAPARAAGQVHLLASQLFDDPAHIDLSVRAFEEAAARAPHSLPDAVALGDALWLAGREDDAADVYRRALRISENLYLDTDKQLEDDERQRIEQRITQAGEEANDSP
jgi:tetratricopeptide (TPR) repeat protein